MKQDTMRTIGCDLGDRTSHLCVLCPEGAVLKRAKLASTTRAFEAFFSTLEPARIVLEVGAHSRWSSALLTELGHQCIVANPRYVRLIYAGTHKNDRLDAEALARLGRLDPTLLRPIVHRRQQTQAELGVLRARDVLVRTRTRLIVAARGMAKSAGVRLATCEADSFSRKLTPPPPLEPALGPLFDTIEAMTERIKQYDRQIAALCAQHPETTLFQTVPGVGPITALAFALTLECPERFSSSRQAAAFVGLVPKQRQSGRHDPQLGITKAGDSMLRRLLVQCAHVILGHRVPDSELRRFGLRRLERGGKAAKKRAIVAVARKLAVLLHRLWVTGQPYRPRPSASPT